MRRLAVTAEAVGAHIDWLLMKAGYLCRDTYEAEELASETIARSLRHAHLYNPGRDIKPWLQAIMYNLYRSRLGAGRPICIQYENAPPLPSYHDVEAECVASDIRGIIGVLRRRYVSIECLWLYIEGYSYREIAEMHGIPIGTVQSRLTTARSMLKKIFGKGS